MNELAINNAINEAYEIALLDGGKQKDSVEIEHNVFLRTDSYIAPAGTGFKIICIAKNNRGACIVRVKNYGPDIKSEREWPTSGIEAALDAAPSLIF